MSLMFSIHPAISQFDTAVRRILVIASPPRFDKERALTIFYDDPVLHNITGFSHDEEERRHYCSPYIRALRELKPASVIFDAVSVLLNQHFTTLHPGSDLKKWLFTTYAEGVAKVVEVVRIGTYDREERTIWAFSRLEGKIRGFSLQKFDSGDTHYIVYYDYSVECNDELRLNQPIETLIGNDRRIYLIARIFLWFVKDIDAELPSYFSVFQEKNLWNKEITYLVLGYLGYSRKHCLEDALVPVIPFLFERCVTVNLREEIRQENKPYSMRELFSLPVMRCASTSDNLYYVD